MPELLLVCSGALWIAALLESVHAEYVGVFSAAGRTRFLASDCLDRWLDSSCRADRPEGRASAAYLYRLWGAGDWTELSVCRTHTHSPGQLCRRAAASVSCSRGRHSRVHVLRDACGGECRAQGAVWTSLWDAGNGPQHWHGLWRRSAQSGLPLPD